MPSRSYNKLEDVLERLRAHLLKLKAGGESLAPGERELATILRASRGTVAKALQQLEDEKFIARDKKGSSIQAVSQRKRYVYIATVHRSNDTFWFHAYYRLWQRMETLARDNGIKIELCKFDPEDEKQGVDEQLAELKGADIVFMSLLGNIKTRATVAKIKALGCKAVLLDENMPAAGEPMAGLDNFAAGKLAGELLHKAGYRRPALIAPHVNWDAKSFRSRLAGFDEAIRGHDMDYRVFCSNTNDEFAELAPMNKCVNELPKLGRDCAFFITDEHIELADGLIKSGLVPEKFGLLAFDGVMKARAHCPPIDCVSHGTEPLARAIIEIVLKREAGSDAPVESLKIQPKHYPGKTLKTI